MSESSKIEWTDATWTPIRARRKDNGKVGVACVKVSPAFRKSWATACELAGLPTALFHDLRRTALTNMIAAGLSELEAMEISGHKTRAVFERYIIRTEKRLRQNAAKLEAHLAGKAEQVKKDGVKELTN